MSLALFVVVALGLEALEWARPDGRHLPLRLGAFALVVLGFGLLFRREAPVAPGRELTLLTPGTPAGITGGYRLGSLEAGEPGSLGTLGALGDSLTAARSITLRGWGLLPHEWAALPSAAITFLPESLPDGMVALEAPGEVGLGEWATVRGRVQLSAGDSGWILLRHDTVTVDSVAISAAASGFRLHDRPRTTGAIDYELVLRTRHLTAAESFGIAVRERRPPRVLVLQGSPNFETGFLKRWLGERDGQVSIRTRVSRERVQVEQVNGPGPPLEQLTARSLGLFDVIIVDGTALTSATGAERALLREAVEEQGVGLLLVPGVAAGLGALPSLYRGIEVSLPGDEPMRLTRPHWSDQPRRPPVAVSIESGRLAGSGAEILVTDDEGAALALRRRSGLGEVGVTLVAGSSRWVLDGDRDLYVGYWSGLLAALARDTTSRISIVSDGPPRPDRPLTVSLLTTEPTPAVEVRGVGGAVDRVALLRDALDPRHWTGSYWPTAEGWHVVTLGAELSLPFRVPARPAWQGVEASMRLEATRLRVPRGLVQHPPGAASERRDPSVLAFLLIVLGTGLLWWEHRRSR